MKLKQVALVAADLTPVRSALFELLGLEDDFADAGVGEFGLTNSVMAIGETFLEVVSPKQEGTTAGRLLQRRGGDGGYMVIAQVEDIEPVSTRIDQLGIRKVWEINREDVSAFHLHPKDIGAAIVSFDEMRPASEWWWAGPDWRTRKARHVGAIVGVTIQSDDPERVANSWSAAFARQIRLDGEALVMALDEGHVRFVEAVDGRGDGVSAVAFQMTDEEAVRTAADRLALPWIDNQVEVCGTGLQFVK